MPGGQRLLRSSVWGGESEPHPREETPCGCLAPGLAGVLSARSPADHSATIPQLPRAQGQFPGLLCLQLNTRQNCKPGAARVPSYPGHGRPAGCPGKIPAHVILRISLTSGLGVEGPPARACPPGPALRPLCRPLCSRLFPSAPSLSPPREAPPAAPQHRLDGGSVSSPPPRHPLPCPGGRALPPLGSSATPAVPGLRFRSWAPSAASPPLPCRIRIRPAPVASNTMSEAASLGGDRPLGAPAQRLPHSSRATKGPGGRSARSCLDHPCPPSEE